MNVNTIPELTKYVVTATFKDETGAPTTPVSASYRLVDADTGATIIPSTVVLVVNSVATIIIRAEKNVCITPGTSTELRQLIITADDLAQVEHQYRVRRIPTA